jgi:hypothetical protein
VRLTNDETRQETHMSVPPSHAHDTLTVIAVIIGIVACLSVAYWRTVLRVILVAAIALAVYGAVAVIYGLVTLVSAHR